MELVYLWVEDYKNIHKQGFNFSPRFNCEYNDETKELTIDENDDYIENFFGENINVTAIVGKNGSGKSSILETISEIPDFTPRKGLLWMEEHNTISEYTYISNYRNIILFSDNEISGVSYYQHINQYLRDNTHLTSNIKIENLLISYFSYKEDLSYIPELNYLPTHIELIFTEKLSKEIKELFIKNLTSNYSLIQINDFIELLENFLHTILINIIDNPNELENYFYIKDFILKIANTHLSYCQKAHKIYNQIINHETFLNMEKLTFFKILKKMYKNEQDTSVNHDEYFIKYIHKFISKKYKLFIEDETVKITIYLKEENLEELLLSSQRQYFELFFYKDKDCKKVYYHDLSSGEKIFINLFSKLYYYFNPYKISNVFSMGQYIDSNSSIDEAIILLDEPDMALHPYWQKKFISYLMQFLNNIDIKNIHIIFTTHSPFLLSDIPRENIIFLDKDEKIGNCIVVKDGLKDNKQTFGANIHTLLSDSFFMKDGLMGEFAKGKINEIIDFHRIVEKNRHINCLTKIYRHAKQKKFWQTQKIIGEEYLKQVIKNHLVEIEKILLGEDEAKKEEIKRVEAYLESLKK